jgi:pimeloyl-ACP methyl ester carboxylesterase
MARPTPALVLWHGLTSSGRAWQPMVAELSRHFAVHTPTVLGHRGGHPPGPRTTLTDFVDDAEQYLDTTGLDRPHLAGHSLGGYLAIELARRGRAASVTAFSPAGFWKLGDGTPHRVLRGVGRSVRIARYARPVLKAAVSITAGRRFYLGAALRDPASMTARQARQVIDDQAGCRAARNLAITDDEAILRLDPVPCPITVAWAEHDEVLPMADYAEAVRTRLPAARFVVLPGVGHAAMVDDPGLVVRTIHDGVGQDQPE